MRFGMPHRPRWNVWNMCWYLGLFSLGFGKNSSVVSLEIPSDGIHLRRFPRQTFFRGGGSSKSATLLPRVPRLPRISAADLKSILNRSVAAVEKRLGPVEQNIYANGIVLDPESPSWFAAASAKTKVVAKNISKLALISEEATKLLTTQFKLSRDQVLHSLPTLDVRGTVLERECPLAVDFPCRPKRYRAYSGYCNNVQNPRWGNAITAYVRYLGADYADYVSSPRGSVVGGALPGAHEVSRSVHVDAERPHPHLTVMLAIFAEFVFHDLFHTSQTAGYRGHRLRCCGVAAPLRHPECLEAERGALLCVNYARSSTAPRTGCTLGPREQTNQATAFLDGSAVYGSSEEEARRLRSFAGGRLRQQTPLDLLPPDETNPHDCRAPNKCFLAGDVRVNENAGLMVMHTVWMREHNRLATRLAELNPHWTDDQLFEETRRIVGAQLQHVTYSELLPSLLGVQVARQFDLLPLASGFHGGYDIDLNPGTANAFAAAVAAACYSMMPSRFLLFGQGKGDGSAPKHDTVGSMQMSETHFQPEPLYQEDALDRFLLGMTNQHAQSMDQFVTREMNNNLVDDDAQQSDRLDVVASVVQQGRDHGLPGYVEWRRACRLSPSIANFTLLSQVMAPEAADKIAALYKDVRDIDLFTGGVSEKPVVGGVVGPTFACILSRQFQHLKKGDRFWYENDLPPNAFTPDQLQEIRKSTLTRILCDNAGKLVKLLQPSPMLMPDEYLNAFQDCDSAAPSMDLSKWKTMSPGYEIPKETLLTSLREAMRQAKKRIAIEQEIFSNNIGVADFRSAEAVHHVFQRPKREAVLIANRSLVLELASRQFMHDMQAKDPERRPSDAEISALMAQLSSQDVEDHLSLEGVAEEGRCRLEENTLPCDHTTPFRSASGWCNNIQNPHWGKSLVTFRRFLPPRYHDGVSAPRSTGVSGRALPSARLVSTTVHRDTEEAPHTRYTLALMQWGQFLDHDITLTPMHEAVGRRPLDCKSCDSATTVHPECLPIPIPPGDPHFPHTHLNNSRNCISFARSLAGQLTLGRREQMDQVTSYIDASNMYGSDACEARMLRLGQGGRLNSTRRPSGGKDLLPQDTTNVECRAPSGLCFESGDIRASEQPGLTSMHTVWMREHNRLADALQSLNPHWDDEAVYQQVRRVVSAQMQHITFSEFLPRVLGERLARELLSAPFAYDAGCDATVRNAFAAAAYRFGHTLLRPALRRLAAGYRQRAPPIQLRTAFFNPDALYDGSAIDEVLRGLLSSSVESFDSAITSEVTNHLFEGRGVPRSGMDLVALNVQRGRDHGLPPYNEFRALLCNRSRAATFEDLRHDIPGHVVDRISSVYEHVDDVDLFTGGVSETPLYGALVGPTFACILGQQFQLLRKCDRFWHETQDPFVRFTQEQLAEIRKIKLSKVICENSDDIELVQMNAFDLPDDFLNPRVSCKSLPSPDLSAWKEKGWCEAANGTRIATGHSHRISPCVTCSCTKEGLSCQSLRISNCLQLASSFAADAVLGDAVCRVQCAFAFRAYPHFRADLQDGRLLGFTVDP